MEVKIIFVIAVAVIAVCHGCAVPELDIARRPGVIVTMSSTHPGAAGYHFPGSKAVDGIHVPPVGPNGAPDYSSLAHTNGEQSPWIQLNLGMRRCITGVKIWNRSHPHSNVIARFRNALITISDNAYGFDNPSTRCVYSPGAQPAVKLHQCPKVMCGQYVRVTAFHANNVLNLYEIEVHGW